MRQTSLLLLTACTCACASATTARTGSEPAGKKAAAAAGAIAGSTSPSASALIEPRGGGGGLSGDAKLITVGNDSLGVHLELKGAPPGQHGVHLSDQGDCTSAIGFHYNPNRSAHHGGPATPVRHGGDLGNIEVDASGKGALDVVVGDLSLASVANGVVGRALVVSERADDLRTDPDGGAGDRIGCGIILAPLLGQP